MPVYLSAVVSFLRLYRASSETNRFGETDFATQEDFILRVNGVQAAPSGGDASPSSHGGVLGEDFSSGAIRPRQSKSQCAPLLNIVALIMRINGGQAAGAVD